MKRRGFTILELLVSVGVIALLLSVLIPVLSGARAAGHRAVCATNQKQIGLACYLYIQENRESLPRYNADPTESDWKYGGAVFAGDRARLDAARPLNRYMGSAREGGSDDDLGRMFLCPGDAGVFERSITGATRGGASVLEHGSCFHEYGTSYRANRLLLASPQGDDDARPLKLSEIGANPSRLMLLGDAAWWYATREPGTPDSRLEASWHRRQDWGNLLAVDGSVRFLGFRDGVELEYTLRPR